MERSKKAAATQPQTTAQSLGSLLKSARDIMRKDKGLNGDLDRLPLLTWIMFLKFLDDLELQREEEAKLGGKKFRRAIEPPYRWRDWAARADGITGDELLAFINQEECTRPDGKKGAGLFAYLRKLTSSNGDDRRDVIATVFRGVDNRMKSGYLLRDVINKVHSIHFTASDELHTLGALYESMLREMRDAAVDPVKEYRLLGVRLDGQGPFLRETILGSQSAANKFCRVAPGDFVYSRLFACRGAFGIIESEFDKCYVSGEFPTFLPVEGKLDLRFLRYWFRLSETLRRVNEDCTGSTPLTRNRFKEQFFLALEISLPPLADQRRIVARIEELAPQIHEARTLRHQAAEEVNRLFRGQLAACMEPHGTNWKRETVAGVILSMDAGWSPQCDDIPARDEEWGVLKTTAVQWCEFWPHQNKVLPWGLKPIPALAVQKGDVLVTRAGPRKRVAVIAAVRKDEPHLTISDKLIRLRPKEAKIDYRFLELSLASPFSQEHLVKRKTGLADAQVNISQAILKSTPIAFPPLPEQRRIVSYLDGLQAQVGALKRLQAETAAELDALLPAILDRAFKGEL